MRVFYLVLQWIFTILSIMAAGDVAATKIPSSASVCVMLWAVMCVGFAQMAQRARG